MKLPTKNPRHLKFASLAAMGTILLTACGYSLTSTPTGGSTTPASLVSRSQHKAALMLQPQFQAGGYKTMAVVNNYTKADINHLVIKIFRLDGDMEEPLLDDLGNPIQADVLNSELDYPITFSNLFLYTTYRIRCFAYKAPGEAPEDLISTVDENSYIDVALTNDDRPTMANLKVKLIDVDFGGEGTAAGITVSPGGFKEKGDVTIIKQTPAP